MIRILLFPFLALRRRYIPLLLLYFAYGAQAIGSVALTFWEKENLALSAEQLLQISAWVMLPWTIKMVWGQLVDHVPIFGSRRKSYILVGAALMTLGTITLVGMADQWDFILALGDEYQLYLAAVFLTALGFVIQDVTADTLSVEVVEREGKTSEEIQQECATVQLLGRFTLSLALVVVSGLGGYLAGVMEYGDVFKLLFILPILSLVAVVFLREDDSKDPHPASPEGRGDTDASERQIPSDKNPPQSPFNKGEENEGLNWRILLGGFLLAIFSVWMAFSEIGLGQEIMFLVSLILLSFLLWEVTKSIPWSKKKFLFLAIGAIFLYRATPSVGPGLQWWLMDDFGFDPAFFGILAQISAVAGLVVLWVFADFITKKPLRSVLILLVVLEALFRAPDLMLYYGVHEMIGISAKNLAIFDTALESPLVHVSMVLTLALIAFYAPEKNRATWFAIGASFVNLALTGGHIISKYLNKIFVVSREVLDEAGAVVTAANYSEIGILLWLVLGISFGMGFLGILLLKKS